MLSFLSLTHAAPAQYIRRDIWALSPQSFALLTEDSSVYSSTSRCDCLHRFRLHHNAFKKYKAIRTQLSHTGGGDPDAARSGTEDGTETTDAHPAKKADVTFTATRSFSSAVLLAFYKTKMFDRIDAVYVPLPGGSF